MKALIYKEFKLSMHPICYIFVAAFPLMILIPSYPIGIGFIYVLTHCHFYAISIHDHHVRSLSSSAKYRRLD